MATLALKKESRMRGSGFAESGSERSFGVRKREGGRVVQQSLAQCLWFVAMWV